MKMPFFKKEYSIKEGFWEGLDADQGLVRVLIPSHGRSLFPRRNVGASAPLAASCIFMH